MTKIEIGDLVTLKGMSKLVEKPIGMVKKKHTTNYIEIFWINKNIAKRFAVSEVVELKKIEVISKANR
tara:strand:- start:936 stop:1139 length:204 start_codon:yes stop_codon:yes gene_type:complete